MKEKQISKNKCCAGLYSYVEYLKSEIWKEVKEKWISTIKRCELCGCSNRNQLTLHHLSYENCGNEFREDILVVCNYCHTDIHLRNKQNIIKKIILNNYGFDRLNEASWLKE